MLIPQLETQRLILRAFDISDEEILERLVALNAERAEEERNGLIRWLRPEYQAPDEVRTQPVIPGVMEPEEV